MSKIHVSGDWWLCEVCAPAHPVEYVLTPEEGGGFVCDECSKVQHYDTPTHDKPQHTQENDNGK